ncbi:MAG: DUF4406 domain-containing protein [Clostridiales bacterium]|nr:DUF4406 domain-containing protein [Clostridiales bacterium]
MMKKIYISGAITGTDDYMERFEAAEKALTEQGYIVINPAKINAQMPKETTYEEYMKVSMTLLDMADGIYMLKGWRESLGANREYGYALGKDKVIKYEDECCDCATESYPCKGSGFPSGRNFRKEVC